MRAYEKSNPGKSPYAPSTIKQKKVDEASVVIDAGEHYRKEDGVKTPYSFLVIISGGEEKEKKYFRIVSDQKRFRQIKVEFIADPKQLDPDGLLQTAKYKQERYQTSQEDEPDKIFIVSDVDHFRNGLLRIKPECKKLGIHLIISNSCFEVWLYYGKFDAKPTDFPIPANHLKISQSLKTYLNRKVKGGINPVNAIFDISKNIQNAKKNYTVDKDDIPELFSTKMFVLAEELWTLVGDELTKMILENEQKVKTYKKLS